MGYTSEFPLLHASGLYAANTAGNGNCLFNALSDQLYGDQSRHGEIRSATIHYMRQHADFYKQFVDVHPGGGVRRNPKRKNAGAFSTQFNARAPTPEEVNHVFEGHLAQMARGGTYGDNMEITAFCRAFNVDVKIYQRDFAYMVPVNHAHPATQVAHIAYHTWEHYSSIRNLTGPHSGPPTVKTIPMSLEAQKSADAALANASYVLPWMVPVVMESLPYRVDRAVIHQTIEEFKGNVDLAVSKLLDDEEQSSSSSRHGSSSVEREPDSDDESYSGPNKKQDRRLSRAKRAIPIKKGQQSSKCRTIRSESPHLVLKQESSSSSDSQSIIVQVKDADETEEEDWLNNSPYKDSESASVSTSASEYSVSGNPHLGGVRLKLSQPKKREEFSPVPLSPPRATGPTTDLPLRSYQSTFSTETTQQRAAGPKKRLMSRNQRDMMRKATQKNAAKERKREAAAGRVSGHFIPSIKKEKENTPVLETHIKVLYI